MRVTGIETLCFPQIPSLATYVRLNCMDNKTDLKELLYNILSAMDSTVL